MNYTRLDHLLQHLILCPRLLIQAGIAKTPSMASRMFDYRAKRNQISLVGKCAVNRKSPEYYWSAKKRDQRLLYHDACVANIGGALLPHAECEKVTLEGVIPDLVVNICGHRKYFEFETGNISRSVFAEKIAAYKKEIGDAALMIVTDGSNKRVENVLELARPLPRVCVTTLAEMLANPWGCIWRMPEWGTTLRLLKPGESAVTANIELTPERVEA